MLSILQALIMAEEDAVKGSAADKTSSFRTIAGVFNPFNKTWGLMRSSGKHGEGRHGKEGGGKDGQAQGNQYPSKMHAIIFKRELFKVMDDTFRAIVVSARRRL